MRRKLTDEERRLWADAMRAVRPLRRGRAPVEPPAKQSRGASEPKESPARELIVSGAPHPAGVRPAPAVAPLARRDKQRLARGHAPIDARIDLHGMTQAQAHAALGNFLARAQADGAKFVLVITGTGARDAAGERGVLRRQVPLWLHLPEFRRHVLGFEAAHIGHGGEGALYVRLRGKRV